MPISTHLIERAYQLIDANQIQNAELVLDAVVRVDPQNVEAWMTYLRIHRSQNDLDWLKERVLKTRELSEADKNELVNYYNQLTQHLNLRKETVVRPHTISLPRQGKKEETVIAEETATQFELIDMYDYPIKIVNKEIRTRPSKRATYTTFVFDIAIAVIKRMLRAPFGRKFTTHTQEMTALANNLVENPKGTYTKLSKWVHFGKSVGIVLLTLFFLGIRLAVSNHFIGYIFLGMSVLGGGWWLSNFGDHTPNQNRVYLHENRINLSVINEGDMDQNPKSDKEKIEVIK